MAYRVSALPAPLQGGASQKHGAVSQPPTEGPKATPDTKSFLGGNRGSRRRKPGYRVQSKEERVGGVCESQRRGDRTQSVGGTDPPICPPLTTCLLRARDWAKGFMGNLVNSTRDAAR